MYHVRPSVYVRGGIHTTALACCEAEKKHLHRRRSQCRIWQAYHGRLNTIATQDQVLRNSRGALSSF
jgi:hypothetical protein